MAVKLLRMLFLILLGTGLLSGVTYGQYDFQADFQVENPEDVLEIKWEDLMTREDFDAIVNAPPVSHNSYGWEDQLEVSGNSPEEEAFMKAMQSFDVNPELINKRIVIPGFIVPTAYDDERKVTEFFLVPFFGACIHVPPPPPNQIIHVKYETGVQLDNYYEAYYVLGKLSGEVVRNELANSAYSLEAEGVEIYTY